MEITSTPPGAQVFVNNVPLGATPVAYRVKPYDKESLRVEAPGYETYNGRLEPTVNLITIINIIFWPAFIVDLITGNFFEGKDVHANLFPLDGREPTPEVQRSSATTTQRPISIHVPEVSVRPTRGGRYERVRPPADFIRSKAAVLPIIPRQSASADDAAVLGNFLEPAIFSQGEYVFELVDRSVVEQTIQELGFQQSDFTDKTASSRLGEILNVNHLIVGIYTQSGDGSVNSLSVRVIEVSTNKLLAVKTRSARNTADAGDQMPALVDDVLREMLDRAGHPATN